MKIKRPLICLCLALFLLPLDGVVQSAELPALYISEIQSANSLYPVEGRICDWIELHNQSKNTISLQGMGITDRVAQPMKALLSGQIGPGEHVVLPCDEEGLGFALSQEGETILLTAASGEVVDKAVFLKTPQNTSLIRLDRSHFKTTWFPTPGQTNLLKSRDEAEEAWYQNALQKGLCISEILASDIINTFGRPRADWVELQNRGELDLSLRSYYLSDDAANLRKYALPRMTLKPGEQVLIYCYTGDSPAKLRGGLVTTAFDIKRTDGALLLSDGEDILDLVNLHTQFGGISYGRPQGQGAFRYFQTPSPKTENLKAGCVDRLPKVDFSRQGGFVEEAFHLTLQSLEGAQIRYTLNGAEPDEKSALYQSPLLITQNTVVRAKAYQDNFISSLPSTQTYLFDKPLPGIPVVCLSGEDELFFGFKGLFEKGNEGLVTERTLNTEFYDSSSKQAVNQLSGIRLTGGTSTVYIPRTFTLYARGRLENESFAFNPFTDRNYKEYSALTLRHGGTDTRRTRLKDAFLTSLSKGFGVMYLASAPAEVYVNGQYYGAFNFREKANQAAIAQWEGISDKSFIDQIDIIKNRGVQQKGSKEDLESLAAYCRANDLNNPEKLKFVTDRLDVRSLFSHTAMEMITGNTDLSNVRYYRVPGGKWKLMLFDLDLSMYHNNRDPLDIYLKSGRYATRDHYGELFNALVEVPAMRAQFLTITGQLLAKRFAPLYIRERVSQWTQDYTPVMQKHFGKWRELNLARWQTEMDKFEKYLLLRPVSVMNWLISAYQLDAEEVSQYFGAFQKSLSSGE